jgi:hypothetical protein
MNEQTLTPVPEQKPDRRLSRRNWLIIGGLVVWLVVVRVVGIHSAHHWTAFWYTIWMPVAWVAIVKSVSDRKNDA